jgi:uncharacterized protein
MQITSLYAALLGILFIAISARTIRLRRKLGIAIGDQSNRLMLRAMRVHSNFAEYTPITLIALVLLELQRAPEPMVHALCIALVIGRLAHAFGVSREPENYRYRVFGMVMTFTALGTASVYLLLGALGRFFAH